MDRVDAHRHLAARLAAASDDELVALLADSGAPNDGHARLRLGDDELFVKLLPLSALELQAEHRGKTANLFGLPGCYQYRFGGCGFGAWRELAVHEQTNVWVLTGESAGFPLLHHSRVLPVAPRGFDLAESLAPWGDDASIRGRAEAIAAATHAAVLFCEPYPLTLNAWLAEQLPGSLDPAGLIAGVERELSELLRFIHGRGLLHMDAHLENVLTDGQRLVLSDYGLAISQAFELSDQELAFAELHRSYDRCTAITCLVYAVVMAYDSSGDWRGTLRELDGGAHAHLAGMPEALRPFLASRAPLAWALGAFARQLLADMRTPWPEAEVAGLLAAID